jgi:hypothetical protein
VSDHLAAMPRLYTLARSKLQASRIEPSCRAAAKGSGGLTQDFASCRGSEEAARDTLVKQWKNFPVADRNSCHRLTTTGTPGTYTELLTSLEMRRDARGLREPDKSRKKPSK